MKASDLRIGNLFYYGERLAEISCIFRTHFNCEEHNTRISFGNSIQCNFEPIPLTEESVNWIDGFSKTYISRFREIITFSSAKNDVCIFSQKFHHINLHCDYKKNIFFINIGGKKFYLQYVHQLQNLYFALTNEELTYEQQK